jgi:hypothetical protein
MSKLLAYLAVYLAVYGALLSSTHASLMTFSDRGAWSSASGDTADFVEDFNRFGTQIVDFSRNPVIFEGNFSLFSIGQSGLSQRVTRSTATTVDGSTHARLFVNADEPTTVRMDFVTPVTAWGADIGQVDDCCELAVVDVYFRGQSVPEESLYLSDGFIGFLASRPRAVTALVFRSGSFVQGDQGQPFGVDNIAGFTIPEPSCLSMLFVCGVTVLGTRLRRPKATTGRTLPTSIGRRDR